MKMKKLSEDHYIICDDSEIKEGDWIGFPNLKKFVPVQYFGGDLTGGEKKITHSTQPESLGMGWMQSVLPLLLSEVKELLGVVDVEKKALEINPVELDEDWDKNKQYRDEWISGYNQALEDNKELKYTEEDMINAHFTGWIDRGSNNQYPKARNLFKQSLQPQTEWEVEFVDGKLKLK